MRVPQPNPKPQQDEKKKLVADLLLGKDGWQVMYLNGKRTGQLGKAPSLETLLKMASDDGLERVSKLPTDQDAGKDYYRMLFAEPREQTAADKLKNMNMEDSK